jgi:hypothetical protein
MTATMFIEQQNPVRKVLKYEALSASSYYFEKAMGYTQEERHKAK